VIEVLTSILVATIGVAGVMVIIPFAVSQAEQGFDQEAATAFGKNFAEEFELRGFNDPLRYTANIGNPPPAARLTKGFVVDPIGTTATPATEVFPYVSPSAPTTISIERTNLFMPPGTPASNELARTLFSWRNDLVSGPPSAINAAASGYSAPELAPPKMYFDFAGTELRRQFEGEFSCVVFCLPDSLSSDKSNYQYVRSWRSHTVVHRRRQLPSSGVQGPPYDRVYDVANTAPLQGLLSGGGELLLANSTFANSNAESSRQPTIRRGDWMALTNVRDLGNGTFSQQLNFYRVLDAVEEAGGTGNWQVSLQGPDFDLFTVPSQTPPIRTYAIHLPDVWAVIERTYQLAK
jgi:hypothetical protein